MEKTEQYLVSCQSCKIQPEFNTVSKFIQMRSGFSYVSSQIPHLSATNVIHYERCNNALDRACEGISEGILIHSVWCTVLCGT